MVSGKEFSFKSAHEQATFEISRKIWSASIKRARDSDDDEFTPNPSSAIVEYNTGFGPGSVVADGALSSDRKLLRSSRSRIQRRTAEEESAAAAAAAAAVATTGVAVEVPIAATPAPTLSATIPSILEETVKSCLSPLFKELLQSAIVGTAGGIVPAIGTGIVGGSLIGMNSLHLGVENLQGNMQTDEKWRNQHILELEVYLKRIELIRDQIKSTLEELKSSTSSAEGQ
ncbi:hypothetical protein HPP92_001733 [Vanilla planifolia]|uniref:Uncharacterized protein n=1 Tax=Vanilla planifolia TaxID=51239 RepID=A0A835S8A5_VANPL|nr:hypothetical protein HPP92_001733 [Vanilla planifolia]